MNALKLLSVLSLAASLQPMTASAIVGGQAIGQGDTFAKSVVGIYFATGQVDKDGNKLGGLCTGTILNDQYIMTAAHCVTDMQSGKVIFYPVVDKTTPPSAIRTITKASFNLDYPLVPALEHNDVGLVRFSGGIPAGYAAAKVLDPKVSMNYVRAGQAIMIAGYGTIGNEPENKDSSGTLRKLMTQIDGVSTNAKEIRIGSNGHVACHGDSGGPAFVMKNGQYYLWGIASRSDCVAFTLYTRMTSNFYGTPYRP